MVTVTALDAPGFGYCILVSDHNAVCSTTLETTVNMKIGSIISLYPGN